MHRTNPYRAVAGEGDLCGQSMVSKAGWTVLDGSNIIVGQ